MGRKPLSQEQRALTKQKLFETSNRMIAENGIEHLSIRSLCNEVGISYSSFYDYYESKDDLIISKLGALDCFVQEHEDTQLRSADAVENLSRYIRLYAEFADTHNMDVIREVYRMQLYGGRRRFDDRPAHRILQRILEEGLESGQLRSDLSLEDAKRMVLAYCKGIVIDWCSHNGEYPLTEFATIAAELFVSSFQKI